MPLETRLAHPLPLRQSPHPPFIGRRPYLDQFAHALPEVRAGQPQVVCLQGEAGIGKTRLLREMQALAQQQGFTIGFSRCYEDLSLPYLPFVEAFRMVWEPLTAALEPTPGNDLELLRRLCQRDLTAAVVSDPTVPEHAEQDKLRLFLAMSRALIELAKHQPTLVAIDDLHWADPASLELFTYLVATVADQARQTSMPLLIVVTHRPGSPGERLTRLLARLQREEVYTSWDLQGLDEAELMALLHALGIARPSPQLLHTFEEVTRGSPLFIQEVLHHLAQHHALREHQGETVTTASAADLRLPAQVTDALLARTARLSADSRDTLILAALLGEEFALQLLSAVSGVPEEALLARLDEPLQQGLLLSEGQAFQFTHPLLRHVLSHLPSVAQRQRLHWQIAQTLIRLNADDHGAHCLEIAHHLIHAGSVADTDAVVQHVRRAGNYAFALCDWRHAAQAYTAVLSAVETEGGLDVQEMALLYHRAGDACSRNGDVIRGDAYHDKAVAAYRTLGDLQGIAQALIQKTLRLASMAYGIAVDTQPMEALLEEVGESDLSLRGRIATALSEIHWAGRHGEQAEVMAQHGLAIGQHIGDLRLCARASFNLGLSQLHNLQLEAAVEHYQQARIYAQQANDLYLEGWPLQRLGGALIMLGRFDDVQAVAGEAYEVAAKTNNWRDYSLTLAHLTSMSVAMGAFDAAERYARETMVLVSRYRLPFGGVFALSGLACAHALRGAWSAAEAALDTLLEPGHVFEQSNPAYITLVQLYRQLIQTYTTSSVRTATVTVPWHELPLPEQCDFTSLTLCCALVELSAAHAVPDKAEQLYRLLAPVIARGVLFAREWLFLTPRILGLAATLNCWWDKAEAHFQAAIATASEVGAQPELGRVYLDYAQMLHTRGQENDYLRALELAHKASLILQRLSMHPFVQRATRLTEALETHLTPAQAEPTVYQDQFSPQEFDLLIHLTQNDSWYLS